METKGDEELHRRMQRERAALQEEWGTERWAGVTRESSRTAILAARKAL